MRARTIAASSISVANTWMAWLDIAASRARASNSEIEYASSPVAHPATHTRTCSSPDSDANNEPITSCSRKSNASRSRKNWVTPISMSASSAFASSGAARRKSRYARRSRWPLTCMRRSIRRSTVARLYSRKSWPVRTRRCIRMSESARSGSLTVGRSTWCSDCANSTLCCSMRRAFDQSSSNRCGMSAAGSTISTRAMAIACCGISAYSASSGVCASVMPPASLMRLKPAAPSEPVPDITMPIARQSCASASVRKKWSIVNGASSDWPRL